MGAWTWDPFRELQALRRDIDRAIGAQGNGSPARGAFLPGRSARSYPLINLGEDKDNYYVEALAPGVDPQSFGINVLRNALTISGEKTHAGKDAKPESFHRNERAAGRFVRTVELPAEVDAAKVSADYRNGLLLVTLPKAEAAKPRKIEINVN